MRAKDCQLCFQLTIGLLLLIYGYIQVRHFSKVSWEKLFVKKLTRTIITWLNVGLRVFYHLTLKFLLMNKSL